MAGCMELISEKAINSALMLEKQTLTWHDMLNNDEVVSR
jgi:hypothetical protein